MAGILELCAKRHCFPVELDAGETVYVRSLSHEEIDVLLAIDDGLSLAFMIGKCLVDSSGQHALPQATESETSVEWSNRIKAIIKPWGADTTNQLREAIKKVSTEPPQDKLQKKS